MRFSILADGRAAASDDGAGKSDMLLCQLSAFGFGPCFWIGKRRLIRNGSEGDLLIENNVYFADNSNVV